MVQVCSRRVSTGLAGGGTCFSSGRQNVRPVEAHGQARGPGRDRPDPARLRGAGAAGRFCASAPLPRVLAHFDPLSGTKCRPAPARHWREGTSIRIAAFSATAARTPSAMVQFGPPAGRGRACRPPPVEAEPAVHLPIRGRACRPPPGRPPALRFKARTARFTPISAPDSPARTPRTPSPAATAARPTAGAGRSPAPPPATAPRPTPSPCPRPA